MRQLTAALAAVLLACLGVASSGDAQSVQPVQIQGTLKAADCRTGQVTMATNAGDDTFQATNQTTAYVNGAAVPLCSLQSYVGDQATAVIMPANNEFVLSQINVTAPQAAASSSHSSGLSSPVAIGLGALVLGGIIGYVIGHNSAPAQQPVYYPYGYAPPQPSVSYPYGYAPPQQPVYYPYGYAPAYLPSNYSYNRPYHYQGHNYYPCTNGGWSRDRVCRTVDDRER